MVEVIGNGVDSDDFESRRPPSTEDECYQDGGSRDVAEVSRTTGDTHSWHDEVGPRTTVLT